MSIEESTKILKEFRNYNKFYKEENKDLTITITLEAKESIDKAIERLLTAYEKEKEKNDRYFKQNIEYQKTLEKLQKETVWKDKIKAKIEEVKKYSKEHGYINMRSELNILQSLLEKE